jgi:hypothetical protein
MEVPKRPARTNATAITRIYGRFLAKSKQISEAPNRHCRQAKLGIAFGAESA